MKNRRGFGTIEIICAALLIVLLLGLSWPKFVSLVNQSKEGQTKYNLLRLRSAIVAYYGENRSVYPSAAVTAEIEPRYIEEIPLAIVPGLEASRTIFTSETIDGNEGKGGWFYVSDPNAPDWGRLYVNAAGSTEKGLEWSKI